MKGASRKMPGAWGVRIWSLRIIEVKERGQHLPADGSSRFSYNVLIILS